MIDLRKVVIFFLLLEYIIAEKNQRRNEERRGIIRPREVMAGAAMDSQYESTTMQGSLDLSRVGDFDDIDYIDVQLLPGGNSLSFEKRVRPSRNKIWYGESGNSVINLVNLGSDEFGEEQIFGSVVEGNEIFHIKRNENGVAYVNRTRTNDFPPEGDPKFNDDENYADDDNSIYVRKLRSGNVSANTSPERELATGSQVEIDIMVVWSRKAECANSGLSPGCTLTTVTKNNMLGLIELAIEETNTAYTFSGIDLQLNLVHSYRHPSLLEKQEKGFEAALDDVTENLNDVHTMRERFGADLVATIIDDPNYCGLAWVGPQKSKGFSVISWSCATGYFSFGHEISHNMGCNHDRGAKNKCNGGGYAYGYRDPDAEFRSILAYSCRKDQCDGNKGGDCTRVQRFSNTKELYNGKSIGNEASNNARQINDVKATIAAWYNGGTGCETDQDCIDADECTDDICVSGKCTYTDICMPPTAAPSPPFSCGGDLEEFEMVLQLDGYPEDISWKLIEVEGLSAGAVVLSGGQYSIANKRHVINECIPDKKYEFLIEDSYGDGFCCKWGQGSLKLSWKGEELKTETKFEANYRVIFGGEGNVPRAPPLETIRPSPIPTLAPSNFPSSSPSISPPPPPSSAPGINPWVVRNKQKAIFNAPWDRRGRRLRKNGDDAKVLSEV